jgi:pimeloyl-ACP methyl ester carboxylesterase
MSTSFTISPDGTRIAYDWTGKGPALVLLHGGGGRRQDWHEVGYVNRLQDAFTVITLDLRGHGESGAPIKPEDYAIEKMMQDVLAVADACGVERFILWGFSFGGRVGRHMAARSERVARTILMGTPLGAEFSDGFRQEIQDFCVHWPPIIQAQHDGVLDPTSLTPEDQEFLHTFNVPAMLAWGPAMLDWPGIEPADLRCPTLWLVGSEDKIAMASVRKYEQSLDGSFVQSHILEGLDHGQVLEQIDKVLPTLMAFSQPLQPSKTNCR